MIEINQQAYDEFRERYTKEESIKDVVEDLGFGFNDEMECFIHKKGDIGKSKSTPSLMITRRINKFHCFSCGASGGPLEMRYRFALQMGKFSGSIKEFAQELISTNKGISKKYGIDTLEVKIDFNPESIQYIFDSHRERISTLRSMSSNIGLIELTDKEKKYSIYKHVSKIKEPDELCDFLAEVQHKSLYNKVM